MPKRYYSSTEWGQLRARVAIRAGAKLINGRWTGGKCATPGCIRPGQICDHIVARADGGADTVENLRWLCRACDNQIKEAATRTRRSGGQARASGCYLDGTPRDPTLGWPPHKG